MKIIKQRALVASLAAIGVVTVGFAQAQAPAKVEKIEVTGSNIKRVDQEGPAPVLVIKKEDIERSGSQTVSDLLRTIPVANLGNFSESTLGGNSFAPGTAAVSLRGLGANTTLVLLNGRRLANYGFGQNVSDAFVDLNSIPISAIERVEILKDGASAIYGSDALAGVINIILRKDYRGIELATTYGRTSEGDGEETRYSGTAGFGDIAKDRFNIMATVDYYKREPIYARDRANSRTADQRSRGGFDLRSPTGNPGTWLTNGLGGNTNHTVFPTCPTIDRGLSGGLATCYYNFMPFIFILPTTERIGGFVRGNVDITPTLSAFAEFGYNKNETENSAAPTPATTTLPVGHNSNPYPFAVGIRYRFIDVGPRLNTITTESKRSLVGLKGFAFGWDWETAYNKSESLTENFGRGYVSAPALATLTSNGIYNYVNPSANSAALVDSLRAKPSRIAKSNLDAFDFKASRELMQLPAGPLGIAVGAEQRKEKVADALDALSAAGNIVGSGGATANGDRKLSSLFAEFSIPLMKGLEAQVAVRTDDYSDFGRATKPKVAFAWKVSPDLLARISYSKGFRAPSLQELYLGQSVSFPSFVDTPRCTAYRNAFGATDPRTAAICGSFQIRTLAGGNPALTAEESKSWNIGFVWEATKDLTMSLDHYRIDHTQKIRRPTFAFQLANNIGINRDPATATDTLAGAPGQLWGFASDTRFGVLQSYFNSNRQLTEGMDLDVRYRMSFGEYGRVTLNSATTYVKTFLVQTAPGLGLVEQAGTYEFPRTTMANSAFWNKGAWEAGVTVRTRSKFLQFNQVSQRNVASFTTADAQVAWTGIKNLKLSFGINNVENKAPPFSDNTNEGYANSTDSAVGRYYYGRVVWAFK